MADLDKWYTTRTEALEHLVTIILALRTSNDVIMFACDSLASDMDMHSGKEINKLRKHPQISLVWGYAGLSQLGVDFSTWLTEQQAPTHWPDLANKACDKVTKLVGEQRRLVEQSGDLWDAKYALDCLIAGWIGGQAAILEVRHNGVAQIRPESGAFYAIGTGAPNAYAVITALSLGKKYHAAKFSALQQIWLAMIGTYQGDFSQSGGKIRVAKITQTRVTHLGTTIQAVWRGKQHETAINDR